MLKYFAYLTTALLLLSACGAKQVETVIVEEQYYTDHVIEEDTTWSGEIYIEGVVLVSRSATLTIEPGTIVRFKKTDSNKDGIGDSEIRVIGRILALGSAMKPIRFESAEQNPQPKDWSYLLIFTSGKRSTISYCEFRHGFTGVQVHFSTAVINNSLFENNNEGLRFGRARLAVENNIFTENDVGIRFTRMEGPVTIRHNQINNNRIGIFLVPSGQNIQDFFEPDRSGRPWNTGRLLIESNNIFFNTWYNLSLGAKQLWDLDVKNNWWGNDRSDSIQHGIFDRHLDPELGRAIFTPFAESPFRNTGIK
jgi:hypothetical protein